MTPWGLTILYEERWRHTRWTQEKTPLLIPFRSIKTFWAPSGKNKGVCCQAEIYMGEICWLEAGWISSARNMHSDIKLSRVWCLDVEYKSFITESIVFKLASQYERFDLRIFRDTSEFWNTNGKINRLRWFVTSVVWGATFACLCAFFSFLQNHNFRITILAYQMSFSILIIDDPA